MERTKLDSFETNGEQCDVVGIVISMGIGRRFLVMSMSFLAFSEYIPLATISYIGSSSLHVKR